MHEVETIYQRLFDAYGPQHWWPADTPFEVMVGAVLTQNTNWKNAERAITNLKNADSLTPEKLHRMNEDHLAKLIKPAGYFRIKAKRLKNLVTWLVEKHNGNIERLIPDSSVSDNCLCLSTENLREELLTIRGIGPETADSILLYALQRPVFVVDAYTYRVFSRHRLIPEETDYNEVQQFFHENLPRDLELFKEYHALIVAVGKRHCRRTPLCRDCPLKEFLDSNTIQY